MKLLRLMKKSALILSVAPLLSMATIYAGTSDVIARGEREHRTMEGSHAAHPAEAHQGLNRGIENRGAYNRGVEAGAIGGAAVGGGLGGAAVDSPVYVAPTQPVQYVAPVPVTPSR